MGSFVHSTTGYKCFVMVPCAKASVAFHPGNSKLFNDHVTYILHNLTHVHTRHRVTVFVLILNITI